MSTKEIKKNNSNLFLEDIKRVSEVVVFASKSNAFLSVSKKSVLEEARHTRIIYYIKNDIYLVKRDVMVIL